MKYAGAHEKEFTRSPRRRTAEQEQSDQHRNRRLRGRLATARPAGVQPGLGGRPLPRLLWVVSLLTNFEF